MEVIVWVFNRTGEFNFFPCAVFSSKDAAKKWILETRPSGVLTKYFLDKPDDPDFPEHYHYEDEWDYTQLKGKEG